MRFSRGWGAVAAAVAAAGAFVLLATVGAVVIGVAAILVSLAHFALPARRSA